MNNHDSRIVEK